MTRLAGSMRIGMSGTLLMLACFPLAAQHAGHTKPPSQQQNKTQSSAGNSTPHSQMDHSQMDHSQMDHSQMDHSQMDHSQMDHSQMDHSQMESSRIQPAQASDRAHAREPIPPLTDADRAAAFPAVHSHHLHGTSIHSYWLMDRLEWVRADGDEEAAWEGSAWIGGDVRKLLLRSEGHAAHGKVESGDIEILYGQGVRAWWDVVAGIRQDFGARPSRTWAAFGVQGMAPYKFEVSATGYLGQNGRTAARLEAEYDTLLTNRWIVQWRAEANLHGKDDAALEIGSGLSTVEAGARLRYEINRHFAPYIGVQYARAFGQTADFRRAQAHGVAQTQWVAGVRFWF